MKIIELERYDGHLILAAKGKYLVDSYSAAIKLFALRNALKLEDVSIFYLYQWVFDVYSKIAPLSVNKFILNLFFEQEVVTKEHLIKKILKEFLILRIQSENFKIILPEIDPEIEQYIMYGE